MSGIDEIGENMINIAIGSGNKAKIDAARDGFQQVLKDTHLVLHGFNVSSGVPDQPVGDDETKRGAFARAKAAYDEYIIKNGCAPAYSIGMEGGISQMSSDAGAMECFAWIVVTDGNRYGSARTASFSLPTEISSLVCQGVELGHADDIVFNRHNSKEGSGTVGHLTKGIIQRSGYYSHAIVLAMIPFIWPELY